jgi:hypothetical protein
MDNKTSHLKSQNHHLPSFSQKVSDPMWPPVTPRWIHEFQERLLIFSVDAGSKTSEKGRAAAERLVNEMVQVPN